MYYNIELINEKTKETILYEDVQDLNEGEKMYFNFQINAQELKDGEYKLNVIDGNGNVVASDTLNVGEFDIVGIQHKRGENVYINTVLDAKTEANDVEIREINSIVFPSGDADAMTSVFVRARPVFNDGYTEGYDNGHTDGYNSGKTDGFEEGKTEGYKEGKTDGIAEGIESQKNKLTPIEITENGTYSNENGYNEVTVNVQDTNGSYDDGYNDGIASAETTIAENAQVLDITANGKYATKYSGGEGNLIKEVNVSVISKKIPLPNGISFINSTFTDFPVEKYDWSSVLCTNWMFANCKNLNVQPIINAINDGTIPTLVTDGMFFGTKVNEIADIDFTKFHSCNNMFYDVIDLDEVRNCKFISKYDDYAPIKCQNKPYKLIYCDFGDNKDCYGGWYFGKFNTLGKIERLPDFSTGIVCVCECDKPSTLKTYTTNVWYDATKYAGWESYPGANPYGFYYNVISKNPVNEIRIKNSGIESGYPFEQVIPYNEEKGCFYTDYPHYMVFDVYVDGVKIEGFKKKFNRDVYIPSKELGVYEGGDIKYLIYYELNSEHYKITEDGLFALDRYSTNTQKIYTPSNLIILTATAGANFVYISKNGGERVRYNLSESNETEIIIDTSDCDYIGVDMYVSDVNKTYLRKIEIL